MKKALLLLSALAGCLLLTSSCIPDNDPWERARPDRYDNHHRGDDNNGGNTGSGNNGGNTGNNNGGNTGNGNGGNTGGNTGGNNGGNVKPTTYTITHIWECVIRRSILFPFSAYVMRCDNGKYYYLLRYRYPQDLHVGDEIYFTVSQFCECEIEEINGHDYHGDEGANENDYPGMGEYLVASDPIEATVYGTFPIKMCTTLPTSPQTYGCIVTTENKLLFFLSRNIDFNPVPGDHFVYNVYTLFPNSILKAKKL